MAEIKISDESVEFFKPAIEIHPFAQQLSLMDIRLLESSSAINLDKQITKIIKFNQSINFQVPHCENPNLIIFHFLLSLIGVCEDENELIRISAKYGELYEVKSKEGFSEEILGKIGHLVGFNLVWPFWREFVHSTILRMGLPPLTLPLMKPTVLKFQKEQEVHVNVEQEH